ncbi:MAG: crosslink repair DNA glycosylase YcaQ family protein, partial [Solirubrobacterales bacterium]
ALLLPRYNPGRRSPLWQQRQRSAQLLEVARKYPSFPIILETVREVLQDVYDLPALAEITTEIETRRIRLVEVESETPSPFARTLLFGYVAAFMYERDSPLAERRAAALSLDSTLLAELLGRAELRELLDPEVIEQTERELQRLAPDRRAKGLEGVVDLLRMLGPMTVAELAQRWVSDTESDESSTTPSTAAPQITSHLDDLARANRVVRAGIAGEQRWAVVEDASRLRDALGVPVPIGVPSAFLEPVADPVGDLVSRYTRTHGPFLAADAASRLGLGVAVVTDALRRLAADRRAVEGEFRPGASGTEWVDAEVLRRLRSRSLAALREEVEPVPQQALARFLPDWQNVGVPGGRAGGGPGSGGALRGIDGVVTAIDQLAGVALPASVWETLILPSRVRDFTPAWIDELTTTGEVLWSGRGELSGGDGWLSLHLADTAAATLAEPNLGDQSELHGRIIDALAGGGAFFFRQLSSSVSLTGPVDDKDLATALWDLAWAGLVTNDTLAPIRSRLGATTTRPRTTSRSRQHRARARVAASIAQTAPPTVAGRWSLLPAPAPADTARAATVRATALAEQLLERHGIVTRGAVQSEGVVGGFSTAYKVLKGLEETGRTRRGYFVEGLGAAQFATPATVDRLRAFTDQNRPSRSSSADSSGAGGRDETVALTLAATDPANPYGAALPWPTSEGHRPGRKAGALVTLVDGALALYVERGGKTVLTFPAPQPSSEDASGEGDAERGERFLLAAAESLTTTIRATGGRIRVEKVDGEFAVGTPLGQALTASGFAATPQGLRLRG